ncbi:MAG: aminodeoxychorismate/anthranilate synthase component II [Anaerolineales bacterium]
MILLIDNYDSFVYNLARYLRELGAEVQVVRNDALTVEQIRSLRPERIVLSPGPQTPREAGVCVDVVRELGAEIPILGVCLGHQCIGAAFGGEIVRARRPMHGKASLVWHDGSGILRGLPNPLTVGRYHSLVIEPSTLPSELRVTAFSAEEEIMAVEHVHWPVFGVQFHPESVLTEHGYDLLRNFLEVRG